MRIRSSTFIPLSILLGLVAAPVLRPAATKAAAATGPLPKPEAATYEKDIKPLLDKYCYDCHGTLTHDQRMAMEKAGMDKTAAEKDKADADRANDTQKSSAAAQKIAAAEKVLADLKPSIDGDKNGIHIASFTSVDDILKHTTDTWALALHNLSNHVMPPPDADNVPTDAERDLLVGWLDRQIYKYDPTRPDPGLVPIHRLNRAEYNNTIRDLLGVDFHPADDFPADDSSFGFDNMAEALSLPPMLLDKYYKAADKAIDDALPTEHILSDTWHFPANQAEIGFNELGDTGEGWVQITSLYEGDISVDVDVPVTGVYTLSFQAYGNTDGGNSMGAAGPIANSPPETPVVSLMVGDVVEQEFAVSATSAEAPGTYQATVTLEGGKQRIHVKMRRKRGGENELIGYKQYVGGQSNGVSFVKYIEVNGPLSGEVSRQPASKLAVIGTGDVTPAGDRVLKQNGEVDYKFNVAKEGDYVLRAYATASEAGDTQAIMDLRINGESYQTLLVVAPSALQNGNFTDPVSHRNWTVPDSALRPVPRVYEIHAHLTPGDKTFGAAFLNAYADPANPNPNLRARTMTIQSLEVINSAESAPVPAMSDVMKKYFAQQVTPANKMAVARDILTKFVLRAWREPAPAGQIDNLMNLFTMADKDGQSFESAMKLPMKAVLVSSRFLFRGEAPAVGNAAHLAAMASTSAQADTLSLSQGVKKLLNLPNALSQGEKVKTAAVDAEAAAPATGSTQDIAVPIDEYALASRLSYFLWSSMPDDELLDLASKNQLRKNLDSEVKRMLASDKAHALVDNFAGQWLQFRALADRDPDKGIYPTYNTSVRNDMETETGMFFDYIMRQNRSVMDFLTADYTFINERLAKFYGLPDVTGDGFQKVSLTGTPRTGILTQGSVLVLTSNPSRTSPVKRGKWVLENILGFVVPPPPPGVNLNALDQGVDPNATIRERMAQHRADTLCASCHGKMDPIGLSLENFDGVGAFRTNERKADGTEGPKIDVSGELATGEKFQGTQELVKILSTSKRDEFYLNIVTKMMTYAVGRGIDDHSSDRAACDKIVEKLKSGDDKFDTVVMGIINSMPFQDMRKPGAVTPGEDATATPKVANDGGAVPWPSASVASAPVANNAAH